MQNSMSYQVYGNNILYFKAQNASFYVLICPAVTDQKMWELRHILRDFLGDSGVFYLLISFSNQSRLCSILVVFSFKMKIMYIMKTLILKLKVAVILSKILLSCGLKFS